jgi:putative FmdB family regulatory protein
MPKYEYACKSCGEHLEVAQSFADAPLTECPACGGQLRKVFSVPAITFKGSGFYRTDSRQRRTEPKADATAEGSTDSKADGKGEPKAEGKGDAKSDAKAEPAKKDTPASTDAKPKAAEAKTA